MHNYRSIIINLQKNHGRPVGNPKSDGTRRVEIDGLAVSKPEPPSVERPELGEYLEGSNRVDEFMEATAIANTS
jgi:hypothetical protein